MAEVLNPAASCTRISTEVGPSDGTMDGAMDAPSTDGLLVGSADGWAVVMVGSGVMPTTGLRVGLRVGETDGAGVSAVG